VCPDSQAALPVSPDAISDLVANWCAADRAHAFLRNDHAVIDATAAARSAIAERLLQGVTRDRDLFHAFSVLGALIGERDGSPTLASATVDGSLVALAKAPKAPKADESWVQPARAAVAEGYARSRLEAARAHEASLWEYPRCAVAVSDGTIAIAAGHPDDDEDALSAWASRVAHAATMAGARRAFVSGSPAAERALAEALEIAGITGVTGRAPPTRALPLRR
jgi:hypothetical protein